MLQLLFLSAAQLRLSATLSFGLQTMSCNVFSSNFSDLTCRIASPSASLRGSLPVGFIFFFFQLLEFCEPHQEYCSALTTGQDVY